jgi:hypothetical protein
MIIVGLTLEAECWNGYTEHFTGMNIWNDKFDKLKKKWDKDTFWNYSLCNLKNISFDDLVNDFGWLYTEEIYKSDDEYFHDKLSIANEGTFSKRLLVFIEEWKNKLKSVGTEKHFEYKDHLYYKHRMFFKYYKDIRHSWSGVKFSLRFRNIKDM